MPATLQQSEPKTATPRSVFILRFVSTIALWAVALFIAFSGYEILFWFLISAFGLIALWEFYGMLDHDRLPNFKVTAMICGAIMLGGSFYYFAHMGPAGSYDFGSARVCVALQFALVHRDARSPVDVELDARHHTRITAWVRGGDRRSGRVADQAQHRRERFRQLVAWNRWRARFDR